MSNIVKLDDGSYLEVTQTVKHIQPTPKPSGGHVDNANIFLIVIIAVIFGFAVIGSD